MNAPACTLRKENSPESLVTEACRRLPPLSQSQTEAWRILWLVDSEYTIPAKFAFGLATAGKNPAAGIDRRAANPHKAIQSRSTNHLRLFGSQFYTPEGKCSAKFASPGLTPERATA